MKPTRNTIFKNKLTKNPLKARAYKNQNCMKKIFSILFAFASEIAISQTGISPQLICSAGGSGDVGPTHFDWSVGEPITLWGGTSAGCDSIFSGFQHCAVDTLRINHVALTIGGPTTFCSNQNVVLTAPTGAAYVWYPGGATTQSYSVTQSGIYHVRVTNSCGDTANSNSVIVNVLNPAVPNICLVSTDSTSTNNIIYWDKSLYNHVDSFLVYRYDVSSTSYLQIGSVSKDSSRLTDIQRNIGGPNGGDPQYGSWLYKLAVLDTCNNIGVKSPYHQSVFVQESFQNFSWNAYTIETGQTNPVTGYAFSRDDNNTGAWHVLINTTGLSATDPGYASYPNGNWRVDALGFNCTASFRIGYNNTQAALVKSRSNVKNNRAMGVNKLNGSQVSVYPNPNNGVLNVQTKVLMENSLIEIYNVIGEKVASEKMIEQSTQLNISDLPSGLYQVRIITNSVVIYQSKIVKQ